MENKKQVTAVEWLFLMLNNPNSDQDFANKLLNKAKEMEKQQQDEFAIGFAEWITQAELPLKELLKTYKKEQGL
jgi:hypothetical protein